MISQEVFVCASKGIAAKHTSSRATHDFFMVEVSSRKVLFLRRHTQAAEHIEMMPIAVFGMADVRCGTNGSNVVLAGTARWAQKKDAAVLLCVRDCNNVTVPVTAGQVWSQVLTREQCSQTSRADDSFIRSPWELFSKTEPLRD